MDDKMTDLEMTKLCAEAMDLEFEGTRPAPYEGPGIDIRFGPADGPRRIEWYDPLHDDARCMALVKKFGLVILHEHTPQKWSVSFEYQYPGVSNDDLNRAIVECVAKMQQ